MVLVPEDDTVSARAAEMAKIMAEEMPEDADVIEFVVCRFGNDTFADFEAAVQIFEELQDADEIAKDWFTRGKGVAFT